MFLGYEIKKINNEEILYLYLDLNTEFAKNKLYNHKTTLNKEINNYILKEKIPFYGKKIFLVASGIILGTCLFTSPLLNSKENSSFANYQYTSNVLSSNTIDNANSLVEDKSNITEEKQEENEISQIEQNNTATNKENNKSVSSNNVSTSNLKDIVNEKENTAKKDDAIAHQPPLSKDDNIKEEDNEIKQETQTKQMVTIKRSNGTILNLELEEYLIGVVAAEMPASFQVEALKSQAIAARTYTMKAIENNITLTDTVSTQAYKDNNQLKSMWGSSYETYYNKVKNAVTATEGLVMLYNGTLIQAYYHSTSNGVTEDSTSVFGAYPYLKSVNSEVDKNVSSYLKTITYSYEDISNKLGIPLTYLSNIQIERNSTNHVSKITIDNNIYGGVEFRTKLGLRSTDFDIILNENNISITTRGYGHGVGMSQYGANEYAKLGYSYDKILKHYYTGITIKKM